MLRIIKTWLLLGTQFNINYNFTNVTIVLIFETKKEDPSYLNVEISLFLCLSGPNWAPEMSSIYNCWEQNIICLSGLRSVFLSQFLVLQTGDRRCSVWTLRLWLSSENQTDNSGQSNLVWAAPSPVISRFVPGKSSYSARLVEGGQFSTGPHTENSQPAWRYSSYDGRQFSPWKGFLRENSNRDRFPSVKSVKWRAIST